MTAYYRAPLPPPDPAVEHRRIRNWFRREKMDTVDIARALNVTEAEADRKLTATLQIDRLVVEADEYDPVKDVEGCFNDAYEAIRARVAAGGPGWTPKPYKGETK